MLLDDKVAQYNCREFIANDPVSFPHSFDRREDVEVVALCDEYADRVFIQRRYHHGVEGWRLFLV